MVSLCSPHNLIFPEVPEWRDHKTIEELPRFEKQALMDSGNMETLAHQAAAFLREVSKGRSNQE